MYLSDIKLTGFKNYETGYFEFDPRINIITGANGVGKTNLLDAIYVVCMTKSAFGGSDKHLIRHGSDFVRLEAKFASGDSASPKQVVAKIRPGKKVFELNGKAYQRLVEHIGRFPIVMVAPDDTIIVTGGSEERRRFADMTLAQKNTQYLHALVKYNRILKQRNALLKSGHSNFDMNLLNAYNKHLEAPANYIFSERNRWLENFVPVFKKYYEAIAEEREKPDMKLKSDLQEFSWPVLMDRAFEDDRRLERTTRGIHRDDFLLTLDGQPLKRFASQGQKKSVVLALKLAQYKYLSESEEQRPILLLDDIFDKLDANRAAHLLATVSGEDFGQVFITDTHPDRVAQLLAIPYKKIAISG